MASRSLFSIIRREIKCLSATERGNSSRYLSSGALETEIVEEDSNEDDLRSRIFRLRLPKRSATNIIQKWINEGNSVTAAELRSISKELRKYQRFKHALEISEWMVANKEFELSDSDYATRIDLMTKVFGIDAAERYFQGLPNSAKTTETYTALLHSYAGSKLVDKAEELYHQMKQSNLPFSAVTYNEMMTLYMSVGLLEKVPLVVKEMKQQKVTPDIFTYNLWISSCAAALDINGVTVVLEEMRQNGSCNNDWRRYIDIANIYVKAGNLVNGDSSAVVEAEKGFTQREWITYDFLIILYSGLGNKDKVDQIWKSLRMTKQKMTNRNFVCVLCSYMMLGHLKEAGETLDQWKECTTTDFDVSACNRLLDAFSGSGFAETANDFRSLLIERDLIKQV